jgi:hypothetical protein
MKELVIEYLNRLKEPSEMCVGPNKNSIEETLEQIKITK